MPRSLTFAAAAILALCSAEASACDSGPWPVEFRRGSIAQRETIWGDPLAGAAWMWGMGGRRNNVRIILYNSGATAPALWEARIAAARSELAANKVPARNIELVRVKTQGGMLAGKWIGRTTKMTVELAKGCGG
jgi:hypothetical protein